MTQIDFSSYYLNQAGSGFPVFQGAAYQRGYGLGGVFRKFFTWIMPIVKQHAVPIAKNLSKHVLKGVSDFTQDALDGKNIKASAKDRLEETLKTLKNGPQAGQGIFKKNKKTITYKKMQKKIKKRKLDIFDK